MSDQGQYPDSAPPPGRPLVARGRRNTHPEAVSRTPEEHREEGPQGNETRKTLKIKPPQFDGKGTLEAFLAQFQVAAWGNGWNEAEMGLHLAASLTGTANEVLATVDVTGPGGYSRLQEELKARYFCTPRTCQRQLASRRWEKGESLRALGDDILRLTCRAHGDLPHSV